MQDNIIAFPEPPPGDTARLVTRTLPVSLTSLIGREHEVQAIGALLLRPDVRLLTLTGTAGVGKTRLALEVARDLVHSFADGVHVVSLAPISDPAFVVSTFEQLQQAVVQGQMTCETLSGVLVYLRASLNGAVLETLRVSSRPGAVSERVSAEGDLQGHPESLEVWGKVQARLTSERERRLAYLLYHCGLEPAEIVRRCPQEWSDVHEVTRLRASILMQLMKGPEL